MLHLFISQIRVMKIKYPRCTVAAYLTFASVAKEKKMNSPKSPKDEQNPERSVPAIRTGQAATEDAISTEAGFIPQFINLNPIDSPVGFEPT